MKKLIMLSSLAAIITFSACAQELDASKVPAAVKTAFAKKFPGATAEWEKKTAKNMKQNLNLTENPCLQIF